jgi:thioredoxin-dependent peroxiredoxin
MYNGDMKAAHFSLPDQDGVIRHLTDYEGKWVVLYFYPKDDTPGCTKEACNFRDNIHVFEEKGVQILGVSKDSVASHKKFADKFKLNFPLLSDQSKEVIQAYGAWGEKKFMGRVFDGVQRNTYLISPSGDLERTYQNVNPLTHKDQILRDLQTLTKS